MRIRTRGAERCADAILVSDLHLTDKTPVARVDDYIDAQRTKLDQIQHLSLRHDCPVLCAGDVFDHWRASPELCKFAYDWLPRPLYTIPGQHDMPMHSLEQFDKSALALMGAVSPSVHVLLGDHVETEDFLIVGRPFGTLKDLVPESLPDTRKVKVLLLHELTWQKHRPPWDKSGWTDRELLERFGDYFDLILTGDNHQSFTTVSDTSILVNPGSLMRSTADQVEHRPKCYLFYADERRAEPVLLPAADGVLSRQHLDRVQARDDRIAAYVERMGQNWDIGLSFQRNLESYYAENSTPAQIRNVIHRALNTTN